ncbi:MAG: tRNA threonylcarbamoyladenosine dehydratase [Bacilli bacterium]
MLTRLEYLFEKKVTKLKDKTVLIIGLGGVGSYALESIVRSGIGRVIIVDNDVVDITNLNRQLLALRSNIGLKKVDIAQSRILDINQNCKILKIDAFITKNNISLLFEHNIDYVIDAVDTIETKKEIIKYCLKHKIKFISSMGTGNKIFPTMLEIVDIRKTSYDPIAKIIRKMVNDLNIKDKVMVVCSKEEPLIKGKIGSTSYVPSVAGLLLASYVINDIMSDKND